MILNEEKKMAMIESAKPLMKWLNDNCHPHCQIVVECTTVELLEGVAVFNTEEFSKD